MEIAGRSVHNPPMIHARTLLPLALLVALSCASAPQTPQLPSLPMGADGFRPLFNGADLTGWVNVNGAPATWTWRDGMLVCSGVPTGVLRSERMYGDFVLELEWRHLKPGGNAGVFVRSEALPARGVPFTKSIEVQVLDGTETKDYTSHGDVFAIHGARLKPDRPHPSGWERCLPSERRARPSPQWNHYKVTCRGGVLELEVNGALVSGASELSDPSGYLCLESEGSEVHFRNLRVKELSPPRAAPQADRGWKTLYDGTGFAGWRKPSGADAAHWLPRDWTLACESPAATLWTAADHGDCEVLLDVRAVEGSPTAVLRARGEKGFEIAVKPKSGGEWTRVRARFEGDALDVDIDGERSEFEMPDVAARGTLGLLGEGGGRLEFANLFVRDLP
jgi:hypothetical protein